MDMYREYILDLYHRPLNAGEVVNYSHKRLADNPLCGDDVSLTWTVEGGRIADIAHTSSGCAISIAATSLLTDHVKGKAVDMAASMAPEDAMALLQIPVSHTRFRCAQLGYHALQSGLRT
jgi:nitrogen fixation protein NifU and related proteins